MIEAALSPERPWTSQDAVAVYVTGHGFIHGEAHWIATKKTIRRQPRRDSIQTSDLVGLLVRHRADKRRADKHRAEKHRADKHRAENFRRGSVSHIAFAPRFRDPAVGW